MVVFRAFKNKCHGILVQDVGLEVSTSAINVCSALRDSLIASDSSSQLREAVWVMRLLMGLLGSITGIEGEEKGRGERGREERGERRKEIEYQYSREEEILCSEQESSRRESSFKIFIEL